MTRTRAVLLLGLFAAGLAFAWSALSSVDAQSPVKHRQVLVFIEDRVSFDELMAGADSRRVAHAGGVALMTTQAGSGPGARYSAIGQGSISGARGEPFITRILRAHSVQMCSLMRDSRVGEAIFGPLPSCSTTSLDRAHDGVVVVDLSSLTSTAALRRDYADTAAQLMQGNVDVPPGDRRVRALVIAPSTSPEMDAIGDKVTPLLMVDGPRPIRPGPAGSLTSDTTREDGVVANVDVAPTILDFFDIPVPKEMTGHPIRQDDPTDVRHLHQLHLDQRRIRLPIQLGEVAFVAALGIVGIAALILLAVQGRVPGGFGREVRFLALYGAALPIPLMAGGLLPRLTYPVVVPFLVLSVAALAEVAVAARWPGAMGPFRFVGAVGLAFVVVDSLFGWRGARIPLIGGTMFDGVRFYGLPNAFIALLLASALFVAVGLEPFAGFLLLLGTGLFAGFPQLGANVGAAATLFVAAGLWWTLRTRPRFGPREVAFVAGTFALGLAAVLLANRYLPGAPTHITGFVERTGGAGGVWETLRGRLAVGFGQIGHVPAAAIPVIGLLVVLFLVAVRPEPFRAGLEIAGDPWPAALVVLTVAGVAAFFLNDTGVAAAGPVFLYAMTALTFPTLLVERRT